MGLARIFSVTGDIQLGSEPNARLRIELLGYKHPDVAEPEGLDLLLVRAHASAPPIEATFELELAVYELRDLAEYLETINSGNGPARTFALSGGLMALAFAPSRRGPVMCAVQHKSIDASHLRVEYLVMLEPSDIGRCLTQIRVADSPT